MAAKLMLCIGGHNAGTRKVADCDTRCTLEVLIRTDVAYPFKGPTVADVPMPIERYHPMDWHTNGHVRWVLRHESLPEEAVLDALLTAYERDCARRAG